MEREVKTELLIGLALALVAFVVYANSLGNGFVWDDYPVILANAALKGNPLGLFSGIDSGLPTYVTPYYRPLTLLSFLIEWRLHGFDPFLVRLFNVLLHSANTFLVFRLIRSLNVTLPGALLAGLLFALHPLQSEAVDFNAGGRNTMLAAFFILAAYLVYKWSVGKDSFYGAFAAAALFLAGLFCKETTLAILPFIVTIEIFNLRNENSVSRRRAFVRLLPCIVCVGIYLALRNNALSRTGANLVILPGLAARLLDNVYIIPRYLLNVVWPSSLSPIYFVPEDLHLYTLQLLSAWLVIVGMLWWLFTRGRSKTTLFGLAWVITFLLPVSGIFPIPSAPLADRYLYVPAIGLWLIVADQAVRLLPTRPKIRKWSISIAVMMLVVLAVVTIRHNSIWRSDITLFSRLIELYPERAYGYHNVGCAYLEKEKNIDLAEKYFEQAFALDPFFVRLSTEMGYARFLRGDLEGSLQHFNLAIDQNAQDSDALLYRGHVLVRLGRFSDALDSYRRFLATPGAEFSESRSDVISKVLQLSQTVEATGRRETKR